MHRHLYSLFVVGLSILATLAYLFYIGKDFSQLTWINPQLICLSFNAIICFFISYLFRYNFLGNITWITFIGILPALATSLVVTGRMEYWTLAVTLPIALLADGNLHLNNILCYGKDKRFAMLSIANSHKFAAYVYSVEMIIPYVWIGLLSMFGVLPISTVLIFLTIPLAIANSRKVKKSVKNKSVIMTELVKRTPYMQIGFLLLLVAGLIIGKYI